MLLDGRALADKICSEVGAAARQLPRPPHLHAILVGDDPASQTYVANKTRACHAAALGSTTHRLPALTAQAELLALVQRLNRDPDCDGILVQLPLPRGLDADRVLEALDPAKDVDGIHPANAGRLAAGAPFLVPATPQGALSLARTALPTLQGLRMVVIGRSRLVGRPLALLGMLHGVDATVTVAHTRTRELHAVTREADLLVVAAGSPRLVTREHIKRGAVVIDVGIHRVLTSDGTKLVGDVDTAAVEPVARAVSPVPGGVGPLTVAFLLANTVHAAAARDGHPDPLRHLRPWTGGAR